VVSINDINNWSCFHIDKCAYCSDKAQHILLIKRIFGVNKIRALCDKHRHDWISGFLNI
jgi:hypothetical protein